MSSASCKPLIRACRREQDAYITTAASHTSSPQTGEQNHIYSTEQTQTHSPWMDHQNRDYTVENVSIVKEETGSKVREKDLKSVDLWPSVCCWLCADSAPPAGWSWCSSAVSADRPGAPRWRRTSSECPRPMSRCNSTRRQTDSHWGGCLRGNIKTSSRHGGAARSASIYGQSAGKR